MLLWHRSEGPGVKWSSCKCMTRWYLSQRNGTAWRPLTCSGTVIGWYFCTTRDSPIIAILLRRFKRAACKLSVTMCYFGTVQSLAQEFSGAPVSIWPPWYVWQRGRAARDADGAAGVDDRRRAACQRRRHRGRALRARRRARGLRVRRWR